MFGFRFPKDQRGKLRFHDSVPSFRQMSVSGVGLNRLRKTRGLQRLGFWNILLRWGGDGGEFHGSNLMLKYDE